ncbi:tetratricopeptide repeat protein [Fibrobacter sp.]|uniref:tetratricopeptide repeat protein n=1 Tax=Fibrobacter sp. TaxID=35828 RepID=UPI00388DAB6A
MKFGLKNVLIAVFALVVSGICANNECSGIETGTKAYNDGDFERAIDEWRTCADNGTTDADLFYNLGNAYFRNGNLGFSIFYYKKALRLRANDDDIIHNLKFAQAMTKDKVDEDEEENPILSTLFKIHHALSLKAQLFVLLAIVWIIALVCIGRRLVASEKGKNVCTGFVFALTAFFCVVGASAAYKVIVLETEVTGVVTAKDADVTSAPNDKAQTLNTLSEGTSFEVLDVQGNFASIRLGEKVKGFVKLSEVGIVE